jgi:hypothetical protein
LAITRPYTANGFIRVWLESNHWIVLRPTTEIVMRPYCYCPDKLNLYYEILFLGIDT